MATIIRAADPSHDPHAVAFNFDDLTARAAEHVSQANAAAAKIVAEAQEQADAIRQQAAEEGRQAANRAARQTVAEQLAPVLSALRQAAMDLQAAKQTWLAHWESSAVRLASAIAARIVRGELHRQPEITLAWVREALELAAGSPNVRVLLNPQDHKKLGTQVRALTEAMSGLGDAQVTADATIERGGCRVETRFGTIDQQCESQLKRIEEELTG
jgi:flagellar biosynthesis/type III secretory pathway protein FliH